VVLDHTVERGNPADAPQLAPAVQRVIRRTGRRPRTVTADRGYGEAAVEEQLHGLGVRTVVIPRKGRPGKARQALEHRPAFRRTVKWRTGSEARISTLKRQYGWDCTRLDHLNGARILDRTGDPGPQPGQDHRPCGLIALPTEINSKVQRVATDISEHRTTSSGRSS
jgi:transposase, IS5 family